MFICQTFFIHLVLKNLTIQQENSKPDIKYMCVMVQMFAAHVPTDMYL